MTSTIDCAHGARERHGAGPLTIGGVRGWPMPDLAGDPCPPDALDGHGWLPWGVIQVDADWWVGLYSCAAGHCWMDGWGSIAQSDDPDLRRLKVSPFRVVPDELEDEWELAANRIAIELVDWSPIFGRAWRGRR